MCDRLQHRAQTGNRLQMADLSRREKVRKTLGMQTGRLKAKSGARKEESRIQNTHKDNMRVLEHPYGGLEGNYSKPNTIEIKQETKAINATDLDRWMDQCSHMSL